MPSAMSKYFPPPTWDQILRHYIPAGGAISYVLFTAHCLNPGGLSRIVPDKWHLVSQGILFNAHIGIGLYCYHRKHMERATTASRVTNSVFITVMFNFGSILFWSAIADALPRAKWIRVSFGVVTSICFLLIGREYLAHIDNSTHDVE